VTGPSTLKPTTRPQFLNGAASERHRLLVLELLGGAGGEVRLRRRNFQQKSHACVLLGCHIFVISPRDHLPSDFVLGFGPWSFFKTKSQSLVLALALRLMSLLISLRLSNHSGKLDRYNVLDIVHPLDDVDGRASVNKDEERVLRGGGTVMRSRSRSQHWHRTTCCFM